MSTVMLIIPITLFVYFLMKARKNPAFFVAIPMLFVLGEAAFLPTMRFYYNTGFYALGPPDAGLILLLIIRWHVNKKRKNRIHISAKADTVVLNILLLSYLIQIPYVWILEKQVILKSLTNCLLYVFFPISVYLWIDLLKRFTRDEIWEVIESISYVVCFLSIFYILSAVGIKVYSVELYQTLVVKGTYIVRDFQTYPFWTSMAFAYFILAFLESGGMIRKVLYISIIVTSMIMTLTRSVLMAAVLQMTALVIVMFLGRKTFAKNRFKLILLLFFLVLSLGAIQYFAPANVEAVTERVDLALTKQEEDTNVSGRTKILLLMIKDAIELDPLYGYGYPGVRKELQDQRLEGIIWGDMVWFQIVAFTGLSGAILLALYLLVQLAGAFQAAMNWRDPKRARMGMFLLMCIVHDIARSTASESYFWIVTLTTIPLAMLMVERRDAWLKPEQLEKMWRKPVSVYELRPEPGVTRP
jgi:hypothetical protein